MNYPGLHTPELVLLMTGLFAEGMAYVFYQRCKLKLRRLARTGRMSDIEVTHNWRSFFGVSLVAIPVVIYLLQ